ncbi:CoF synthetase [Winogradskyella flava]|uniref:CoF synthetase n=1 Tax=Winogradskyella flava TaxID=1884876 RepID=UPI002491455C|nr:CoF synthetase [Winogradskyella flava]
MNLRSYIFWALDRLKGNPLKIALRFTSNILETKDRKWAETENANRLKELLNHASKTTSFYMDKNYTKLEDFPIVNKNMIRDNLENFMSHSFEPKDCLKVSTSGSTGAPFSIYQDRDKVNKSIADNIYFSSKSDFEIGNRLVYIKIWSDKLNYRKRFGFRMKNILPWSVFNLSNTEIDKLLTELNNSRESISFIGYASSFEKICKHLDELNENPIKFKTKSVITISESLNLYTRNAVKQYFGIYPMSRYSNNENGIIAQQNNHENSNFILNSSSYVVEIFDLEADRKLKYGEQGRIVITDLYNKATPIIRYDTGDIGTLEVDSENRPYFSEIYGRKLDLLYDTQGNLVPSHLSAKLCNYGEFKQFQLVQKGQKNYEINLNTTTQVDELNMIKEYKKYFGEDADIKINYVSEIPLLASGKRREVVNEYYV